MINMNNFEESKFIKQNKKLINILRFYEDIDKVELSRKLQVSMPTIYKSIDDLNNIGIVKKEGSPISINSNYGILVGISIGASLCKIVFLNFNFNVLEEDVFSKYKNKICKKLEQLIKNDDLLEKSKNDKDRNYVYFRTPNTFSALSVNVLLSTSKILLMNFLNVYVIG